MKKLVWLLPFGALGACTVMNNRHLAATKLDASPPPEPPPQPAAPPPGGCDDTMPFTSFEPIREVNTSADELLPRLTADELTLYFYRADAETGGAEMFVTHRAALDAPFSAASPVLPGSSPARMPAPSADGRRIYFVLGGFNESYRLAFADVADGGFATPQIIDDGSVVSLGTPFVGKSSLYLYVYDGTDYDLSTGPLDAKGALGARTSLAGINSSAAEEDPVLSADELTLYFYSERERVDRGRIFVARRTSATGVFSKPAPVDEIVRPDDGWVSPGYLSNDNCRLYYYATDHTSAPADLFVAKR